MAIDSRHRQSAGAFLLFAAFVLLLLTTLSSPIINRIGFLKVYANSEASNGVRPTLTFGTFGYCVYDFETVGNNNCSEKHLGYNLAGAITSVVPQIQYTNESIERVTRSLILQPIATGLAFIAFLIALIPSRISKFFASGLALLTAVVTLVVWAIELGIFISARNFVNNSDIGGLSASLGAGIWMNLAATAVLLIGSIVACFECCCGE